MSSKIFIPKQIAGAKLEKGLRRVLRELGGTKAGRRRVAGALAAFAGALALQDPLPKPRRRSAKPAEPVDSPAPGH